MKQSVMTCQHIGSTIAVDAWTNNDRTLRVFNIYNWPREFIELPSTDYKVILIEQPF